MTTLAHAIPLVADRRPHRAPSCGGVGHHRHLHPRPARGPGTPRGLLPVSPEARRRRRRAVAALVSVVLALGLLRGGAGSESSAPDGGGLLPVARSSYVVQPGDTVWGIARALQPTGDVRPLVDRLVARRHGAPLRVGERVELP